MKHSRFPLIPVLGICLVTLSLLWLGVSQFRLYKGANTSQQILSQIENILPEYTHGTPEFYSDPAMPVLSLDGTDYVAVLDIPAFGITLPVQDQWQSNRLSLTPARFSGSAYDSTLVIGGADHSRQFGFCDEIENGAFVTVTDMTGAQFNYTVAKVDRAKHAEIEWLVDKNYHLTLFYRDAFSTEYLAVRCVFAYS